VEDRGRSAGDPRRCARRAGATGPYKATKSVRAGAGVGGVHSTAEGRESITRPEGRDPALFVRPKQRKVGAIAVRLTTPENIRTLQRKLYQKAKQRRMPCDEEHRKAVCVMLRSPLCGEVCVSGWDCCAFAPDFTT
jgi:hypothetical protein